MLSDDNLVTPGATILLMNGSNSELIAFPNTLVQTGGIEISALANSYDPNNGTITIHLQDDDPFSTPVALTVAAESGSSQVSVDNASSVPIAALGDPNTRVVFRDTSVTPNVFEIVEVIGSDATNNTLDTSPLVNSYPIGADVNELSDSGTSVALFGPANSSLAPVFLDVGSTGQVAGMPIGSIIRIQDTSASANQEFAVITSLPVVVDLAAPLTNAHRAGTEFIVNPSQVLTVHARWPGAWGDSLHVSSRTSSQVETTSVGVTAAGNSMQLITAFGLFPGSVVTVTPSNGDPVFSREVATVDVATGIVTFTAAILETPDNSGVVSQEFSLLIERVVDGKTVESEFFEKLSLASEHPRYALKILGSWDTASATPSETGDSSLVRLSDNADATSRVMPLVHDLRRPMDGGSDDVAGIDDNSFIGVKADDPDVRTGIQALENEPTISLVAVPGQTSVNVQKELLTHCEKMRYRFAVLDTPLGSNLQQARTHRQNFDSTRAAIYYPGLVIPDQFGDKGATRVIPSSGHTVGVYARTDVVRGVHKVPANEVVRGIQRFEIGLTKGAQDILNPIHVNCHRDFRSENRGLRVYGGRVATSDPEFRYVNVRRLMLFIEQSLDVGLQWAVFEPNSEPLWASVKQSVTGFLNTVWRSGALEGTVQEEAFFVNIGYDVTMTQTDVDNGRMIVEIGVAPVKPAEFVIARISQKTRDAVS